jgi:hypothetical protein
MSEETGEGSYQATIFWRRSLSWRAARLSPTAPRLERISTRPFTCIVALVKRPFVV